jgi:hypothetical protein
VFIRVIRGSSRLWLPWWSFNVHPAVSFTPRAWAETALADLSPPAFQMAYGLSIHYSFMTIRVDS